MVSAPSHRVSRVPWYSGSCQVSSDFGYGALTLSGRLFQSRSPVIAESLMQSEPRDARITVWALPRSLAATYGIDVSFSSSGYLDVSVPRVPFHKLWIHLWMTVVHTAGFPHSEISGSKDICSSPKLIAAYHVFHRLSVPRHPPCALFSLTNNLGRFAKQRIRRRLCLRVTAPFLSPFVFMLLMSSVTLKTFIALFFFVKK